MRNKILIGVAIFLILLVIFVRFIFKNRLSEFEVSIKKYETEFELKQGLVKKRKALYNENRSKASALLYNRCSQNMQDKFKSRTDFNIIKNNYG